MAPADDQAPADGEDRSIFTVVPRPPDDTWSYGALDEQVADVYLPVGHPAGAPVVLVHGGFWRAEYDRTHLRPLAAALAAAGRLVVSLEYRRAPGYPEDTIDDLTLAISRLPHLLSAHGASEFCLVGHSAGGHLSLVLARQSTSTYLTGCVALAPVADLRLAHDLSLDGDAVSAFLGCDPAERPGLDPARLPSPDLPVLILHGEADTLVPVEVSHAYARGTGVEFDPLPACGHFELIDPSSAAWPELVGALGAVDFLHAVGASAAGRAVGGVE